MVARLRGIAARLPRDDGIAWFNRLYLRVTERVDERLRAGGFHRPRFLARLDVVFAGLYVEALDADRRAPRPWRELIDRRERTDIAPAQFALAGMNAHITYDLPIALTVTSRELGVALDRETAEHEDFQEVNLILESVEDEVVRSFEDDRPADGLLGRMEERLALWSVVKARDQAWAAARQLMHEPAGEPSAETLATLAEKAGHLGELLLDC